MSEYFNNHHHYVNQGGFYPQHIPYGLHSPQGEFYPHSPNLPNTEEIYRQNNANEQPSNNQQMLPIEESYIENILRLNKGKLATFYMTFDSNKEWNAKIFHGRIEGAGRDHIVIHDPETGKEYLLLMIYLDYVEFDEPIEYEYPFDNGNISLSHHPPR